MADCFEYAEIFEDPEILSYFCYHPFSDGGSSVETQFTCIEHQNHCPDLEQFSDQDTFDNFIDQQEYEDTEIISDEMSDHFKDIANENVNDIDKTNDNVNENLTDNDNINVNTNDYDNDDNKLLNDKGNDNNEPPKGNDTVDGSLVSDKKDIDRNST